MKMIKMVLLKNIEIPYNKSGYKILLEKGTYNYDEESTRIYSLDNVVIGYVPANRLWCFQNLDKYRDNRINEIFQD